MKESSAQPLPAAIPSLEGHSEEADVLQGTNDILAVILPAEEQLLVWKQQQASILCSLRNRQRETYAFLKDQPTRLRHTFCKAFFLLIQRGPDLMNKHHDLKAFFMEGALEPSSDPCAPLKDERKTYADLYTWRLFAHFLELGKISRDKQKATRTRTIQQPVTVSVRWVPPIPSRTIMGNPELRPAAVPSEQLDGMPQQAVYAYGERALMRAVLADAIHCYQRYFMTKNWRVSRPANEAASWFADDDERWPFSFVNICRALRLEPDYLRRGLKKWQQQAAMTTLDEKQSRTVFSN